MRRWIVVIVLSCCVTPAAIGAPATQPVTQPIAHPATRPHAQSPPAAPQLTAWFAELGDPDADVRAAALGKLLAISGDDLAALRAVVEAARPVSPAQAAALHDVVVHVYLSGETYETNHDEGFLGVKSLRDDVETLPLGGNPPLGQDGGVPVGERLPGFCGFRGLRGGDVILGVTAPRPTRLVRWSELLDYVKRSVPGETITFEILRQGKIVQVPLKLDPRPIAASDPLAIAELISGRTARAESYWTKVFKPLLERDVL